MPSRTQLKIRRDINRLKNTVDRHAATKPALAAIKDRVDETAQRVNETWQRYQRAVAVGDKERGERDSAVDQVRRWVQGWRPVVLLSVPGASANLRTLPATGATPDDMVRVAEDLRVFITENEGAAKFRNEALAEIGNGIEQAGKEIEEATDALPAETAARATFTEATLAANEVVVRGSEVLRAIFGPTSPEYKQFISRESSAEAAEDDDDSTTGEGGAKK